MTPKEGEDFFLTTLREIDIKLASYRFLYTKSTIFTSEIAALKKCEAMINDQALRKATVKKFRDPDFG